MNKIKDFLYYISDLILAFIVILVILFVFYKNISVFFYDIFGNDKISVQAVKNLIVETADTKNKDIVLASDEKSTLKNEKESENNDEITIKSSNNQTQQEIIINQATDSQNTQSNQSATDIVVVIPANSISTDIVNILYDNKIISSKEEMSNYLKVNNLETKLKSGTFTLNSSMSIEEIVRVLSV